MIISTNSVTGKLYIYNEKSNLLTYRLDLAKEFDDDEAKEVIKRFKQLGFKYQFVLEKK